MRHYHLAQVNVGRMIAPLDSPALADFVAQLDAINALADQSPGFVWRLKDATTVQAFHDALILVNLSVWESIETLREFTYKTAHAGVLRDRTKWFERPAQAHLAMWWIPAGHIPSVEEARDRLEYRRNHGDTPIAFSFPKIYADLEEPSGAPATPGVNFNNRMFISAENTPNGDCTAETRFHYHQDGARVWAVYGGGSVQFGSLVGIGDSEGRLNIRYHHLDSGGQFRAGKGRATPEVLPRWTPAFARRVAVDQRRFVRGTFGCGRSARLMRSRPLR